MHNEDLTSGKVNKVIKLQFSQYFYLLSAIAVSGQNTCQDYWPPCLFIYKARLMMPDWERGLMNEWDILWRKNINKVCAKSLQSCLTLWDPMDYIAHQAPLSMGFSRQKRWSGLPCPSPGDLPNPGIKPASLKSPALAGRLFTTSTTWEALTK